MSQVAKFDSRKYRVALGFALLLTVMQLADKLTDVLMQGLLGLAGLYMVGNVGAAWVAQRSAATTPPQ